VIDSYLKQCDAYASNGGGIGPGWLVALRREATEALRRSGFPTSKDEEWRFTSVAPITRADFSAAPGPVALSLEDLGPYLFGHLDWPRLVFVNGAFSAALSGGAPGAGDLSSLAEVLKAPPADLEAHLGRHVPASATPFTNLNTALAKDGGFLRIRRDSVEARPVHLVFIATPEAENVGMHHRSLVIVEPNARVQLVESYLTLGGRPKYWTNSVVEISVGAGAWVEHSRIQRESEAAFHTGFTQVSQDRGAHYRSFSLAMGGLLARHDLRTRLGAPDTEALLYGLYIGHKDQLLDNHTVIYHDEPNCRSWEVYKGILDDRSHGVFNGKIFVRPEAQKTDAKQTNRALLLSDTAKLDTKPQLEIFADDVKCTHGATVGQLDPLWSFYLRSRGIPAEVAHRMLVAAFAAEVLEEIASPPVREALGRVVQERLGRVG
jgi:Fe-S cluster assembly protein SufD